MEARADGGHKGHASLKFEKDGSLAKCASGAPKSIADKKVQKSAQDHVFRCCANLHSHNSVDVFMSQ